jgi:predicted transcriptional regulator of viral defense system
MMITSKAAPRIGPVEHRVLQALDRSRTRVWRVTDGGPSGITQTQLRQALHYLTASGLLERIERGTYLVLPRSGRILVSRLELVGAWFKDEPHVVVGHAAAEYHRVTLDTSTVVEVQLSRAKKPIEFQGVRYVFSKQVKASLLADNVKINLGQTTSTVASPGKLLVLLLNQAPSRRSKRATRDTRLALEVIERGVTLRLWAKGDWVRLVRRHGNASTARRLGYLLERAAVPGAESLLALRGNAGNVRYSPIYPPEGHVNTRWRLILNDPLVT